MIRHTTITRLDGLILTATVDETESNAELHEAKAQVKLLQRRLNRHSTPRVSANHGSYQYHYVIKEDLCFLCICDRSYPRDLAFEYLEDIAREFTTTHQPQQYLAPACRPYAFVGFDSFIERTKKTYQDSRATQNLDKLRSEIASTHDILVTTLEDVLNRGASVGSMLDKSDRLKGESGLFKNKIQRMNWELRLKQYGPIGGLAFIFIVFIWWRFF